MNKQVNSIKTIAFYVTCIVVSVCFNGCKKEISEALPGNIADVGFNFYIASDVMNTAYAPNHSTVAAYVDKYQEQPGPIEAGSGNAFPAFSFGYTGGLEYPGTNTSTNDGSVNYVRYNAGSHRLLFTDVTNTVVLDTTINAKPKTFNGLYLTDEVTAAGSPAKYKLVVVNEERKAMDGKTGVRFIHLSADAGNLTCNIQKDNGELSATQVGELGFGQYSAYQFFGPDEVATGGLLRFTLSNAVNRINFTTGVPFASGRNYVILILGFHTDQQRQIATGKNPDGSIKGETITVSNNLRAEIRRSY